ncbi:TetR/AcrR family transcriptional regulator [Paraoerskovia sediminicola]|nr:TetR/AcrR family transcriptional regulator [Paraoerskovia sediminicola]
MLEESQSAPSLRHTLAATTRSQVVDAAAQLFAEQGYTGSSIGAIAQRAGVAVQTIYNSVGNKVAVLSAVLDAAASGPRSPTPVPVFMAERTSEISDPVDLVHMLADWFVEVNERTAPIHWIIRQAASLDEGAAELERARARQRLHNYQRAAASSASSAV